MAVYCIRRSMKRSLNNDAKQPSLTSSHWRKYDI